MCVCFFLVPYLETLFCRGSVWYLQKTHLFGGGGASWPVQHCHFDTEYQPTASLSLGFVLLVGL